MSPRNSSKGRRPSFIRSLLRKRWACSFQGVYAQLGALVEYEGATAGDTNYISISSGPARWARLQILQTPRPLPTWRSDVPDRCREARWPLE